MTKRKRMAQGQSNFTKAKQDCFQGIAYLATSKAQEFLTEHDGVIRLSDVMCGEGMNGRLRGSPISLLNGSTAFSRRSKKMLPSETVELFFSDNRQEAIDKLKIKLKWPAPHKNKTVKVFEPYVLCAADAIERDIEWVRGAENRRTTIFIDPNGPSYFPTVQIEALLSDPYLRDHIDVVIHVSATALKRVIRSKESTGWNFNGICNTFKKVFRTDDDEFRNCWIRMPLKDERGRADDEQWTILVYWRGSGNIGKWAAQKFVRLSSPEGKDTVEYYNSFSKKR